MNVILNVSIVNKIRMTDRWIVNKNKFLIMCNYHELSL
jgi:hypothetical protein